MNQLLRDILGGNAMTRTSEYPLKTPVRILGFTMTNGRDWSETGVIVRNRDPMPEGYNAVRSDVDGAVLLIHSERLMLRNAEGRS